MIEKAKKLLSDAIQGDLENGVAWMNDEAVSVFDDRYPEISAAIGKILDMEDQKFVTIQERYHSEINGRWMIGNVLTYNLNTFESGWFSSDGFFTLKKFDGEVIYTTEMTNVLTGEDP